MADGKDPHDIDLDATKSLAARTAAHNDSLHVSDNDYHSSSPEDLRIPQAASSAIPPPSQRPVPEHSNNSVETSPAEVPSGESQGRASFGTLPTSTGTPLNSSALSGSDAAPAKNASPSGFNLDQNSSPQRASWSEAGAPGAAPRSSTPATSGWEAPGSTVQDRRVQAPSPTSTDSRSASPVNKEISPPPMQSLGSRPASVERMPMPQAPTAGPERSQPTWYRMRDNAARQVAADQQAQASAQSWGAKPPVTAATAVTDRPVQERAANVWPATDLSMQGRAAPDWPVTDKSVNDRSVTGQVMGGKDAKSKTLPWSDNPDPTTRPVEIKPEAGTVATGGSPPDRRDQPVGLGGKLGDGSTIGAKDPNGGASAGPESDKSSGKAPSNPAGSGAPGIIGQIIDGHGGMKPPVIWSPFGDKGGAKEQDADAEKGQKSGRRQTQADGRTPAEALLGILDSIKGGIGGGTRLGQFGKTNQFVKPDRVGRMDPFIKPIQVGRQDPVGKQGKFVIPGQNGKGDKTSKTELTLTGVTTKPWPTAKDGSPTSTVAILTPFLSGTKGGLRVIKDVTQSTTKDVTQSSTKDVNQSTTNDIGIKPNVIGAKLGPMLVGPGSAPFDDTALGFDTVKMKPLDASHEGENPDVAAKDGRQKARPSVNLHLPGGTYGGGKSQTETEPSVGRQGEKADAKSSSEVIPPHGEAIPTHGEAIPTKPWISAGTEETLDHSQTVASIPSIAPLEGMTRPRPAKAIDESESTVQMEAPERSPAKRAHAHPDAAGSADVKDQIDKWGIKTNSEKSDDTAGGAKGARPNQWSYSPTSRRGRGVADRPVDAPVAEKGSEGADGQSNDDIHITSTELSRDSLQKEDQFTYVVQQGDTIESVAVVVLQDSALASLLFSLNRRYVLPEEQYGVHPLMVGVVIQLPSPTEILKYRQILS